MTDEDCPRRDEKYFMVVGLEEEIEKLKERLTACLGECYRKDEIIEDLTQACEEKQEGLDANKSLTGDYLKMKAENTKLREEIKDCQVIIDADADIVACSIAAVLKKKEQEYLEMQADVISEAHEKGVADGRSGGYNDGISEGYENGYNDGYNDGVKERI